MPKGAITLSSALILLVSTWAMAAQPPAEPMCVPMGNIELTPPESVDAQRPAVTFPHAKHFAIQCQSCHHGWSGGEAVASCSSSGCHDLDQPIQPKQTGTPTARYFKEAFHRQCIGCHKTNKLKNRQLELSHQVLKDKLQPTGPTGCIECHFE